MIKIVNIKDVLVYKISREIYCSLISLYSDIKEVIKEHFWERKLGINTSNISFVENQVSMFRDIVSYQPSPYYIIETMLKYLQFSPADVFIDLGCGKGRVIFSIATKRLKKVVGIEVRQDMVEIARQNLKNLKLNNTPIQIVHTDVATFDMREGTVFFLYNPFFGKTQTKVMENIKNSLVVNPRNILIVCYRAPDLNVIEGCDWLIEEGKLARVNTIRVWRYNN